MLLIASPLLPSSASLFFRSVVLVTAHGDGGTRGVVLNKRILEKDRPEALTPLPPTLTSLMAEGNNRRVVGGWGGPVGQAEWQFVWRGDGAQWEVVGEEEGKRRVLRTIVGNSSSHPLLVAMGRAGWRRGQLAREIRAGWWSVVYDVGEEALRQPWTDLWDRLSAEKLNSCGSI